MNLLLFQNQKGEPFPVMESAPQKESAPRYLHNEREFHTNRWRRFKSEVKRYYRLLETKLDYQERLCSDLRHAHHLEVHHASSLGQESARRDFTKFLKNRYKKHFTWLWIDGVLAILGSVLTPVPGPNVFFFYPAARTLGHYFAMKGAKKILADGSFSLHSEPLIDEIQGQLDELETVKPVIEALEKRYNVPTLGSHLRKLCSKHRTRGQSL